LSLPTCWTKSRRLCSLAKQSPPILGCCG
jgi:hypothetical protein